MVERSRTWNSRLLEALGRALVAGLLGTAAMTVASTAEAKLSGLRGPMATLVHLIAVLGAEQVVLLALRVAKPMPCDGMKALGTDTLHHAVYAGASGLAYDHL